MEPITEAPAVPETPAATPAQPEAPTTIQATIAAARAELDAATKEGRDPSWVSQPRDEQGKWSAPEAEAATEGVEQVEPQTPEQEPEAPAGEAETDENRGGDTSAEVQLVKVTLPGRRPGDPEEEHEVPATLAERVNQLRNGYMHGTEIRQIRHQLRTDPVGFLAGEIHPSIREQVVRELLADGELFGKLLPDLSEWENDPAKRDAYRLQAENERLRARAEAPAEAFDPEFEGTMSTVAATISQHVPQGVEPSAFEDAVLDDLIAASRAYRLTTADLTPEYVRQVIEARATPGAPLPLPSSRTTAAPAAPAPSTPAKAAPPAAPEQPAGPTPAEIEAARSTGKTLVEARQRVTAAAAVATPGAGAAPASTPQPPANQSVKERIAWARQQMGR